MQCSAQIRGFIVGASLFAATMVLLYLSSTLYHALPQGKAKLVFKIIEPFNQIRHNRLLLKQNANGFLSKLMKVGKKLE